MLADAEWAPPVGLSMKPMGVFSASVGLKTPAWAASAGDKKHPGAIKTLDDLPQNWWVKVSNSSLGYNYRTHTTLLGEYPVETLLDGGASVNSVTEEIVVGAINAARAKRIYAQDPSFPVAQLEYWPRPEEVTRIKRGATVPIIGAAVLRVQMTELGKHTGPEVLLRCKVFKAGVSDWHGIIMGAAALDCTEQGGLGHRVTSGAHVFEGLGIRMARVDHVNGPSEDAAYHVQMRIQPDDDPMLDESCLDEDPVEQEVPEAPIIGSATCRMVDHRPLTPRVRGVLAYDGQGEVVLEVGEGAWIPVSRTWNRGQAPVGQGAGQEVVGPLKGSDLEAAPGIWQDGQSSGTICVMNRSLFDVVLQAGDRVAAVWETTVTQHACSSCGFSVALAGSDGGTLVCTCGDELKPVGVETEGGPSNTLDASSLRSGQTYHIVEDVGAIDRMTETEVPSEEYYRALRADMGKRHPSADPHVLDHLLSLEALLDVSIVSGFPFGIDKAILLATEGPLLGDVVGRDGRKPNGERAQAVVDFAPLKNKQQVQQFLGCTNWLRWYLVQEYAQAAKYLGKYLKPDAEFPDAGLGAGSGEGETRP